MTKEEMKFLKENFRKLFDYFEGKVNVINKGIKLGFTSRKGTDDAIGQYNRFCNYIIINPYLTRIVLNRYITDGGETDLILCLTIMVQIVVHELLHADQCPFYYIKNDDDYERLENAVHHKTISYLIKNKKTIESDLGITLNIKFLRSIIPNEYSNKAKYERVLVKDFYTRAINYMIKSYYGPSIHLEKMQMINDFNNVYLLLNNKSVIIKLYGRFLGYQIAKFNRLMWKNYTKYGAELLMSIAFIEYKKSTLVIKMKVSKCEVNENGLPVKCTDSK